MLQRSLGRLGALVRTHRGAATLREAASRIGIGPATLLRVESGRMPDVTTFGRLCQWLGVNPGSFLGYESTQTSRAVETSHPLRISAHLSVEQTPDHDMVNALAKMILFAVQGQRATEELADEGGDGRT